MVTVRVEHGDVLSRATDVLVLKYARALHGVDREAVTRIGTIPARSLPAVGKPYAVPTDARIGADYLRGHRHLRYSSAFELQRKLGDELAGLGW